MIGFPLLAPSKIPPIDRRLVHVWKSSVVRVFVRGSWPLAQLSPAVAPPRSGNTRPATTMLAPPPLGARLRAQPWTPRRVDTSRTPRLMASPTLGSLACPDRSVAPSLGRKLRQLDKSSSSESASHSAGVSGAAIEGKPITKQSETPPGSSQNPHHPTKYVLARSPATAREGPLPPLLPAWLAGKRAQPSPCRGCSGHVLTRAPSACSVAGLSRVQIQR